eukprot:Clim_evm15s1 gene=Clim_evmTU15s1
MSQEGSSSEQKPPQEEEQDFRSPLDRLAAANQAKQQQGSGSTGNEQQSQEGDVLSSMWGTATSFWGTAVKAATDTYNEVAETLDAAARYDPETGELREAGSSTVDVPKSQGQESNAQTQEVPAPGAADAPAGTDQSGTVVSTDVSGDPLQALADLNLGTKLYDLFDQGMDLTADMVGKAQGLVRDPNAGIASVTQASEGFMHKSLDVLETLGERTVELLQESGIGPAAGTTVAAANATSADLNDAVQQAAKDQSEGSGDKRADREMTFAQAFAAVQGNVVLTKSNALLSEQKTAAEQALDSLDPETSAEIKDLVAEIDDNMEQDEPDQPTWEGQPLDLNVIAELLAVLHFEEGCTDAADRLKETKQNILVWANQQLVSLKESSDEPAKLRLDRMYRTGLEHIAGFTLASCEVMHDVTANFVAGLGDGSIMFESQEAVMDATKRMHMVWWLLSDECSTIYNVVSGLISTACSSLYTDQEQESRKDALRVLSTKLYLEYGHANAAMHEILMANAPVFKGALCNLSEEY